MATVNPAPKTKRVLFTDLLVLPASSDVPILVDVRQLRRVLIHTRNTGGVATAAGDTGPLVHQAYIGAGGGTSGVGPSVVQSGSALAGSVATSVLTYDVDGLEYIYVTPRNQNAANNLNLTCTLQGI